MMTRMLLISLCIVLSQSYAGVVRYQDGDSTIYNFKIDDIKLENIGSKYVRAKLMGVSSHDGIFYKEGFPEIPVIRFYVEGLDVDVDFPKREKGGRNRLAREIIPSQKPLEKRRGASNPFLRNDQFYSKNVMWPVTNYSIEDAGVVRGKQRKLVTLFPFHYNPATGSYHVNKEIEVTIKTIPMERASVEESKGMFAFIVGEQFENSPSLQKYVEYKKWMGFTVRKIVVGRDVNTVNEIRSSLQALLSQNLKYAMIVGDSDVVPSYPYRSYYVQNGMTDHYYRAIDTNDYRNDLNGPDIGVGRITPKNEMELESIIAKFIKYQNKDFEITDWMNRTSFIATDDTLRDSHLIAQGTHDYVIDQFLQLEGFYGMFPDSKMAGGDRLYAIKYSADGEDVLRMINEGRYIINYSGHGVLDSWVGPRVTQEDVRELDHSDALPFVVSNACLTGTFVEDESFGETWIKHSAIMFWGAMDLTTWDEDDILEKGMYRGIFQKKYSTFSEITQYALLEMWRYYGGNRAAKKYWEIYVTFGDPSIKFARN